MKPRKPIFYDEQRRRWRRTSRVLEISGAIFTLLVITFFVSILISPRLPEPLLPTNRNALHPVYEKTKAKITLKRSGRHRRIESLGQIPATYDPLRAAFYVSWDPTSLAALQQHFHDIDLLIPERLHSITSSGRLDIEDDPKLAAWEQTLSQQNPPIELPTMPLMNNSDGTNWLTDEMAAMLKDSAARQHLSQQAVQYILKNHFAGLVIDFEEIPEKSQKDFSQFIAELATNLHNSNLKLMVCLPAADWIYDYAGIGKAADAVILMNYDQHWLTSGPGPIAAQDWFVRNIEAITKLVPARKLVMGVANYAYDWPINTRKKVREHSKVESFQEAIVTATESDAKVVFDADSLNPDYSYSDERDVVHRVWMLDGVTAYNELRAAERIGVQGTALWRLGTEDPSIWPIWDVTHPDDAARAKLEDMPPGYDLILEGDGDIWKFADTPQKGKRTIRFDASMNDIVEDKYESLPSSYRIFQMGAAPYKIALSFDDGPDRQFTPRILDILKQKKTPATFFVIGSSANDDLGLIRREYAEGHEIGNHTYTHPRWNDISRTQIDVELNVTERLLNSTLGVKTLLFRPPYGIDHQPETADEVSALPIAQSRGYIIVGARIDPHDWGEPGGVPPAPASVIVQRVLEQAHANGGNIVLLHDGGGDRRNTVEALPEIIDGLRAAGFQIVPVSELLGQTRAQLMPPLTFRERLVAHADGLVFTFYEWSRLSVAFIFILGIGLVSCRAIVVGVLAIIEKFRASPPDHPDFLPLVSVLIPAYNEEDVIVYTVNSVLESDYPKLEVIVVDDGSTDGTGEMLDEQFGRNPAVRVIHQPNRGKPAALSHALAEASSGILVTIDADTAVEPSAISKLVRHFVNPRVGAVAGNVKVGNRISWLTRWQALEYVTSQNLEKRAFDLLNCIPVVPGALSAWRAEAINNSGGFSADTVAEDTDLTITIRRAGWKIYYEEDAIGWTDAPETAGALVRQRFRWTFGTLQAFWKHRDTLGRSKYGTLGWIALPNVFLFQLLLPLFSPVIDLLFLGSLILYGLSQFHFTHLPQFWTAADVQRSLVFFIGFMLIDFMTCIVAFTLERHEDWSLLWPLLLQRFYYRQMMYVVLFRAVMGAVQGKSVGWRGVEPEVPVPVTEVKV
ncbi:MAG: glycosyltransferase [Candidatus Acidiferrales bacterium]|jgi:cellulose synthase/poly-beta-1,6-N-acetylglucosamine synthase-like glycosyltransferase/peptidoglycan/xylan/chitin deacetylase (PgdA/CDA1 family)